MKAALASSLACALFAGLPPSSMAQEGKGRIDFSAAGDFSEAALLRGVKATQGACERAGNAIWASTREHGAECLRYWAAGFDRKPVARAIVFFHGDVLTETGVPPAYLKLSMATLQRLAEDTARELDAPYIFFARPGTHGSSGDHRQRRRIAESVLVSAALDQLKSKLQVSEWVIAGQSGGGHVTSSLLTERADIVCAVPTSAPSSPRIRWTLRGMTKDSTGYTDSYEPSEHVQAAKMHAKLRVFVLGDPKDSNVLWASQTVMADKLKQAGVAVETLRGEGAGPHAHGLPNSARRVAGWCHHGLPTHEILRKAAGGLKG
jgi:pimeloyl-ACP methyl ester carboxylesterase